MPCAGSKTLAVQGGVLQDIVAAVPGDWLGDDPGLARENYVDYFLARRGFAAEAEEARRAAR